MIRKYLLDDYVTFIPSDSSLTSSRGAHASFLLPVPAARLLQVLLERSPELTTREELLVIVWEKYGMKGSMHNLSHYTMILRKAFSYMQIDKRVIITVHKKGLMINPQIVIKVVDFHLADEPSVTPSPQSIDTPTINNDINMVGDNTREEKETAYLNYFTDIVADQQYKRWFYNKWQSATLVIIAVAALITGLLAWGLWPQYHSRYSENSLRLLTKIDNCKIYTFNPPTTDSILINDVFRKIENFSLTSKTTLNCKKDRVIIYYTDAFLGPNLTGKTFHSSLTLCTESKGLDNLNSCVSHYYN